MIELKNVFCGYGKTHALEDISVSFSCGKITGIIGPNGSGKSTLLKAILGLIPLSSGRIIIDGQPLSALSAGARAKSMAFFPQHRPIPEITVEELAALGRYAHMGRHRFLSAQDKKAVEQALAQSGALPFRKALLSQLSGGEQQRAYLGQMLAQDAGHLMMDEPINHLDPQGQLEWMGMLKTLALNGRAVIIVLHHLPLAMEYCDELLVLEHGRMQIKDAPQALLEEKIPEQVFGVRLEKARGSYILRPL